MSLHTAAAYTAGQRQALATFSLEKQAGILGKVVGGVGKALKWGGRVAGSVPAIGTAANAVIGGVGGLAEGFANQGFTGKGLAEGVARAGANIATGSLPVGAGLVAGAASDLALDKVFAKKPPGPAPQPMPGMMGAGAHLPGQAI
jgi:hypothetical protein